MANFSIESFDSGYQPVHIDNDWSQKTEEFRLRAMAETFADWLVLSRMDHLVISRSGFGEMASTFGGFLSHRGPTYRLPLGYNETCNFQEDYYISTDEAEHSAPPAGNVPKPDKFQT